MRAGTRLQAGLVVESGDAREVHHIALVGGDFDVILLVRAVPVLLLRGRARLVMIFQEPGHLVLVVELSAQVVAHRPGVSLTQAVV